MASGAPSRGRKYGGREIISYTKNGLPLLAYSESIVLAGLPNISSKRYGASRRSPSERRRTYSLGYVYALDSAVKRLVFDTPLTGYDGIDSRNTESSGNTSGVTL